MNLYDKLRQWIKKKHCCPKCDSYNPDGLQICPIGCPAHPPFCIGCNRPIWNKTIEFYGATTCHSRKRCRDKADRGREEVKEWLESLSREGVKDDNQSDM